MWPCTHDGASGNIQSNSIGLVKGKVLSESGTALTVQAKFVKSSSKVKECPRPDRPEYAFVGRSNVGKSSLINALTNRKSLAKISGKPGKTQLINHFSIDESKDSKGWYLVDLPGYGYAKVSKSLKASFQKLIQPYLKSRENLMCVFLLIDSRHEPQPIDVEFMEWMAVNEIPFVMVFTKIDKLKESQLESYLNKYNTKMLETWEALPQQFITSSSKKQGIEKLLEFVIETNKDF
jgi:GTP-binding protein